MVNDKFTEVVDHTHIHIPDWDTVTEFENRIAEFFGAPHAVAVDSCTHGLELCLRYLQAMEVWSPRNTYVSIPMLAKKLRVELKWHLPLSHWTCKYPVYYCKISGAEIIDAATLWERNSYITNTFMCLSFQYQKHLSLGRGGMILCPDAESEATLRKMSYDGRERGIPWREQDIDTMGYHYYMTPETAALGLQKLPAAIATEPRIWSWKDYPDVSQFKVFKK